ncbi:MBL fold metallo-hydrolase [Paenibacillus sp. UMB4589-SE434]|uniref:MBL fold metallo-hydrolase n=1 Tax=Paenibacillus sp. UMB4589-SE434 TaxID=3046314 RepID=UPI00254A61E5|nr:MBL fold metallo-hydrolase [Paenibacillus sp. UMB4589-SE434]MDK8181752.1 MBL fold metallo-hydrolase [Paenibacillus sp. UMB4589-SE434]
MFKMFNKKSSMGVILLLCFTLLLSACTGEASTKNTTSEGTQAPTTDLKITPFNPGENGLFSVSSSLIEGPNEILLVDAQFEKKNAEQLVKMIRDTGKKLTTVYISHKDPDFYFGLSAIREAFPDVKIVATPATVERIKATIQIKSDFWSPILKDDAPAALIVPEVLNGDKLTVDGETVQVIGLDGSDPSHTVLWVPSKKTILGGVPIYENLHVWMADNQTPESRDHWREILDRISDLKPERVIPGHYLDKSSETISSVAFTRDYIAEFEAAAKQAKNSTELIAAMQKAHPNFKNKSDLEMGAQVIKGERSWP